MLNGYIANPTQLTGLLSFAAAAMTCLMASHRSPSRETRTWRVLALANLLFFIEVFVGTRHAFSLFMISVLAADGYYWKLHGAAQAALIIFIAAIAVRCTIWILSKLGGCGGAIRLATLLTILVALLFAIEAISLHGVDAIFYRLIGPVMEIGWAWAAAATVVSIAAILSMMRRREPRGITD